MEAALPPPEAHAGRGTAVYIEDLACYEIRRVGDEEGDGGSHVFGVADAAPGDRVLPNSVV